MRFASHITSNLRSADNAHARHCKETGINSRNGCVIMTAFRTNNIETVKVCQFFVVYLFQGHLCPLADGGSIGPMTSAWHTTNSGVARNLILGGINCTISNLSWVKDTKQPHKKFKVDWFGGYISRYTPRRYAHGSQSTLKHTHMYMDLLNSGAKV